jgi:rare lipoprotein A (peptidoglycan hydrolase)
VVEVCYRGCARVTINDRNPYSVADLHLSRAATDRVGLTWEGKGLVDAEVVE